MITILNGKLTIPESERFIGFAGDNLARTIEFLLSGRKEADRIYRLYLTFDDGTVNYFVLPCKVVDDGVLLTWSVKKEHIYKSGNVRVQIKAFSDTGVVYHTGQNTFIVGNSAEFSDSTKVSNTEFLEYEEMLNNLKGEITQISTMMPYIGDNGNWFVYDVSLGEYKDSGQPSCCGEHGITVDQSYNPTSKNPQSGTAVAQALADFDASNMNCWQRKYVSADTYVALDTLILTGSSDYDMFVLTLGPDLLEEGMSFEPLIAYIDGKLNGYMFMMDMGNGSWWKYQYKRGVIYKVTADVSHDFRFLGYQMSLQAVANAASSDKQLYMIQFDGETIRGTAIPYGYYLVKREEGTIKLTSAITDGKVYTYTVDSGMLTVADITANSRQEGDFVYAGSFYAPDEMLRYPFEPTKSYSFRITNNNNIFGSIPTDHYVGLCTKLDSGEPKTLMFRKVAYDGINYTMNLDTGALNVTEVSDMGGDYKYAGYFSTVDSMIKYPFEPTKSYSFYIYNSNNRFGDMATGHYTGTCPKVDAGDSKTLIFRKVAYDGINYTLNLDSGVLSSKNILDGLDSSGGTGDFIYAGSFYSLAGLREYSFVNPKFYNFYLNGVSGIPTDHYVGLCTKLDSGEPKTLMFRKVAYDGINYTLNLDTGTLSSKNIFENSGTAEPTIKNSLRLNDPATGKVYDLYVQNGKLTMEEVM